TPRPAHGGGAATSAQGGGRKGRARALRPPKGPTTGGDRASASSSCCTCASLFAPEAGGLDDRAPHFGFGLELGGKELRRRADHGHAKLLEPGLGGGLGQNGDGVIMHLLDDGGRRPDRNEEAVPRHHI